MVEIGYAYLKNVLVTPEVTVKYNTPSQGTVKAIAPPLNGQGGWC